MHKIKKQSFVQGIVTLMFSQVFIKIFGLVYKLYLTNKEGFGDSGNAICSSGFQIYALLLTISSVGVPSAVSKLVSERVSIGDERGGKRIFKIAFALFSVIGFISSTFLFINANFIAVKILQIPEAELTLQVLAPSIFFVSIISVFRGYFNAKENMRPTANSQAIEQFVKTIFTIGIVEYICAYISAPNKTAIMAAGASVATTIATFIGFLYLFSYYKRDKYVRTINGREKQDRIITIIKNIAVVSAPITISAILGTINKNIDSVTIVRGLQNYMTAEEAKIQYGILSGKVETLITLPMSFNIALTTSLIPAVAAAKARNCLKDVEKKINISLLITILIGLPSSIGMIIFAKQILNLLFPNASSGAFIYQISSISIVFVLLNQTITGVLQGLGKQFVPVLSLVCGVIVKLIVNLILVPMDMNKFILGGTAGAALGTTLCYAISMVINFVWLNRSINIKFNKIKFIVKPVGCVFIMALASKIIFFVLKGIIHEKLATILSIISAIAIYILCVANAKIFEKGELKSKKNIKIY